MIYLREPVIRDADKLFPMIFKMPVTDTILWDGPESLESYRQGLALRLEQDKEGRAHWFVIVEKASDIPVGSIDCRPEDNKLRGDIGLWIGNSFQGKGYGTQAVKAIVEYGFKKLNLQKIEASIFVGNIASRRIFEKNKFTLEGTIRKAAFKRGQLLDQWLFGMTREEF